MKLITFIHNSFKVHRPTSYRAVDGCGLRRYICLILCILLLLVVAVVRRQRPFREAFLKRASNVQPTDGVVRLGILTIMKNEAMGLREWLTHYSWQGVDSILLLDNGSTDTYDDILADFPFATLLPAPERYAQALNYGELGRPWLEAHGIDFVAVLDIDEFFWSEQKGATLKDLVVNSFKNVGLSQFTCPFYHFGSNGYERQPKSVRECLTKRSLRTSEIMHGKSVVRLRDLLQFNLHVHDVTGTTGPCPSALLNFHYKAQSREYWEKVKLPRGDVNSEADNSFRSWRQFEFDDITGNATHDFRLRAALSSEGLAKGVC